MAAGKLRLHLIVAVAQNQGIGYEGALPWPRIGYIKTHVNFSR